MAEQYPIVYIYIYTHHIFVIHSSVNLHLELPCPGYNKYCCSEHRGTCSFFIIVLSRYMPRRSVWQFYFQFLRKFHTVLHSDCTNLHFYLQYKRVPFSPHYIKRYFTAVYLIFTAHTITVLFFTKSYLFSKCNPQTSRNANSQILPEIQYLRNLGDMTQ